MGYFRGGQKWPQPANKKLKTDIYLNIYIKVVRTKFLWVLNFGQVGVQMQKNQKHTKADFFKRTKSLL